MYCYIIRGEITGRYKVGVSRNIKSRMASYAGSCSERMEVLFVGLADGACFGDGEVLLLLLTALTQSKAVDLGLCLDSTEVPRGRGYNYLHYLPNSFP